MSLKKSGDGSGETGDRRACQVIGIDRRVHRYQPKPDRNVWLRQKLRQMAEKYRRWGSPMLHDRLRLEGHIVNHKRVERIYREEGLALRLKRRRKRAVQPRVSLLAPTQPNERWSMDFVSDQLYWGRRFRCLTVVDDGTKEAPIVEPATSFSGERVVEELERAVMFYGLPKVIRIDNGPEFQSRALDAWAYQHGVQLEFTRPGKPTDNCYIESFNGKFRNECLNEHWFTSLDEAKERIEKWRHEYNEERPHRALGGIPPRAYGQQKRDLLRQHELN
jgi:putative transposase